MAQAELRLPALEAASLRAQPCCCRMALIAFTDDQTWIIEGDMLRIVEVHQGKMQAHQQFYALEPWGDPAAVF